jgi:hypothetical protein
MKHLPEFRSATVLLCAAAFQFAGCAVHVNAPGDAIVGNGAVEEETRALEPFDRVDISNGITAVVHVDGDDPHAVTVAADGNLLAHVDTRIEGSTLVVEAEGNIDTDNPILVTTAVPVLRSATAANAVDLYCEPDTELLDADGSSSITTH